MITKYSGGCYKMILDRGQTHSRLSQHCSPQLSDDIKHFLLWLDIHPEEPFCWPINVGVTERTWSRKGLFLGRAYNWMGSRNSVNYILSFACCRVQLPDTSASHEFWELKCTGLKVAKIGCQGFNVWCFQLYWPPGGTMWLAFSDLRLPMSGKTKIRQNCS